MIIEFSSIECLIKDKKIFSIIITSIKWSEILFFLQHWKYCQSIIQASYPKYTEEKKKKSLV